MTGEISIFQLVSVAETGLKLAMSETPYDTAHVLWHIDEKLFKDWSQSTL